MATYSISYCFTSAFAFLVALDTLSFQVMTASGYVKDTDLIKFALNLEFLEAEYFLYGAPGRGLDAISPNLAQGGPPPVGARKANLDILDARIIEEFAYQEVGHIRKIVQTVRGFPRPMLNLSRQNFAKMFDEAMGFTLIPPFDPNANTVNYLLASYLIPSLKIVGSLLGVEAGQDAVIRGLLYQRANQILLPYAPTVAEFTNRISALRNKLGNSGNKDEGIRVPRTLGAENKTTSNVLSADVNSLSYARTPPEILRILYGTSNESLHGRFYPQGANGKIARTCVAVAGGRRGG